MKQSYFGPNLEGFDFEGSYEYQTAIEVLRGKHAGTCEPHRHCRLFNMNINPKHLAIID